MTVKCNLRANDAMRLLYDNTCILYFMYYLHCVAFLLVSPYDFIIKFLVQYFDVYPA